MLCFKQKTAYEMRISDWSSDVCSSDLAAHACVVAAGEVAAARPLNFYDARAHVRQLAGTERGGYRVLKRNDGNTLQWQHAISLRTNAACPARARPHTTKSDWLK